MTSNKWIWQLEGDRSQRQWSSYWEKADTLAGWEFNSCSLNSTEKHCYILPRFLAVSFRRIFHEIPIEHTSKIHHQYVFLCCMSYMIYDLSYLQKCKIWCVKIQHQMNHHVYPAIWSIARVLFQLRNITLTLLPTSVWFSDTNRCSGEDLKASTATAVLWLAVKPIRFL